MFDTSTSSFRLNRCRNCDSISRYACELSGAASEHCATNRKEGNSDARLEVQSKPPQGQMASRPFSRDEEKRHPLWDGSDFVKYIEEVGSGTSDIFAHCAAHGLEPPIFDVDARHVSVTVIRPTFDENGRQVGLKTSEVGAKPITNRSEPITKIGVDLPDDFDLRMAANRKDFRERAKRIWLRIARDSDVTVRELAQECGFGLASTQGVLNALREAGLLEKTGKTHNGVWHVIVTPKGR